MAQVSVLDGTLMGCVDMVMSREWKIRGCFLLLRRFALSLTMSLTLEQAANLILATCRRRFFPANDQHDAQNSR